jgi:hypothetical protein
MEALGGEIGKAAWAGMQRLVGLVWSRAAGNHEVERALNEVDTHPRDEQRIRALAERLSALALEDSAFLLELNSLVATARRDPVIGHLAEQSTVSPI